MEARHRRRSMVREGMEVRLSMGVVGTQSSRVRIRDDIMMVLDMVGSSRHHPRVSTGMVGMEGSKGRMGSIERECVVGEFLVEKTCAG